MSQFQFPQQPPANQFSRQNAIFTRSNHFNPFAAQTLFHGTLQHKYLSQHSYGYNALLLGTLRMDSQGQCKFRLQSLLAPRTCGNHPTSGKSANDITVRSEPLRPIPDRHLEAAAPLAIRTRSKFYKSRVSYYGKTTSRCSYQVQRDSFIMLVLLSGDIQLNPGPVKQPCSVCKNPVARTHSTLRCDSYMQSSHIGMKCGNVDPKQYEVIKISVPKLPWVCPLA